VAVGLAQPGTLYPVSGVRLATVAAGIRYQNRDDMVLISLCEHSNVAAVYTQNKCKAAPVTVAIQNSSRSETRALLINSGNANAVRERTGFAIFDRRDW